MRFCYLDKTEKEQWLPELFDLFYENMRSIAPLGLSYRQEKEQWLSEVSPALEKAPRQIILCLAGEQLVGYMQYYIREGMLMVEELQLKPQYQGTLLFCGLCKHLLRVLPGDLKTIEAYAHLKNRRSIDLMKKLGMEICQEQPPFAHLRGSAEKAYQLLKNAKK